METHVLYFYCNGSAMKPRSQFVRLFDRSSQNNGFPVLPIRGTFHVIFRDDDANPIGDWGPCCHGAM